MKTFLFYDIETSGLHRVFDQILTFASIRTDHKFNEIERNSFIINLRKDIVPSAKAFLTHGLTYEELEKGISEYESAIKIHKILNTKNTINLGYNSLGFDDVFLRFMFYRNLLDPYTHQYRNGCSRMDLLPITTLFKVFLPDTLKWPMVEDKPSLKLDKLSRENNFVTSGKAHQAMSDVEAVIELSKALSMQESVWKYSLDFFNKTKEENRINDMKANIKIEDRFFKLGILISIHFGSKLNYMAPVIYLGRSKQYVNQKLFLRLDSKDILKQKSDTNNTGIIRKKVADAMILLPVKERFLAKMPEFSSKIAKENIKILHDNSKRFFELIQYHRNYRYPFVFNIDADASLYQDGFFSDLERNEIRLFHNTSDDKKKEVLKHFQSSRVKILANRILERNFECHDFKTLNKNSLSHIEKLRSSSDEDKIIGFQNDIKMNCAKGLQELNDVKKQTKNPDENQIKMFKWIKTYIENL